MATMVATELASRGVQAEVIDPRTVSPIDTATILASVTRTGRLVVVDEDTPRCSVGADIIAAIACGGLDLLVAAPQLVTVPHAPVPFSAALEDAYLPSPSVVIAAVERVLYRRSDPAAVRR